MKEPPSLQKVARVAGVSCSTVSRALRNSTLISKKTRAHVRAVADKLGYQPDPLVTTLTARLRERRPRNEQPIIAYISSHPSRTNIRKTPYFRRLFQGAELRALEIGFRLQEFLLQKFDDPIRLAQIMKTRDIRGIVFGPMPAPATRIDFPWSDFSIVALGNTLDQTGLHRVRSDYFQAMSLALARLREYGYQRIGFIARERIDRRGSHRWRAAFLLDQKLKGAIDPTALKIVPAGVPERQVMTDWIRSYRPDAIITPRNTAYQWITQMNISIPADIALALTSVDSTESFFSGVDQRLETVGAHAVDLLVEQFYYNERGLQANPKTVILSGTWIDGKTTP